MGVKKSVSKLKKELDKWFSLYIRLRDATDMGVVQCFTCGKIAHYKSGMQCGHFQSRRFMATRYDERNQIQCVKCNMFEQGMQWQFGLNLDAKYGLGTAEELQLKARQPFKMMRIDYVEKISYYKDLVNKIKKEKSIE